jgi:hypothetical protein
VQRESARDLEVIKMRRKEVKEGTWTCTLDYSVRYGKSYIAKIVGPHDVYHLDRVFMHPVDTTRSCSGKTGTQSYKITEDGYYEVQEEGERTYYNFHLDSLEKTTLDEVNEMIKQMVGDF